VYLPEFIVSKKEMGLIMFVMLVVHHTPNLMLCTGTLYIGLGVSAILSICVAV
jgi:hypothetical protein